MYCLKNDPYALFDLSYTKTSTKLPWICFKLAKMQLINWNQSCMSLTFDLFLDVILWYVLRRYPRKYPRGEFILYRNIDIFLIFFVLKAGSTPNANNAVSLLYKLFTIFLYEQYLVLLTFLDFCDIKFTQISLTFAFVYHMFNTEGFRNLLLKLFKRSVF